MANQVKNVVEYSLGSAQEVFRGHLATVVTRNTEFVNLLGKNPLEDPRVVADFLGEYNSEAHNFKKI